MVVVESKSSDQLWPSFSLALAKPNNKSCDLIGRNIPVITFNLGDLSLKNTSVQIRKEIVLQICLFLDLNYYSINA